MYLTIRLLKKLYTLLEGMEYGVSKYKILRTTEEFIRLYMDGLPWDGKGGIKEHLIEGCHCKELKGKEARQALNRELRGQQRFVFDRK